MRSPFVAAAAIVVAVPLVPAGQQVELDRTLQRVYGTAITSSDVRRARVLKLAGEAQSDQDVLTSLENRLLILRELSRGAAVDPEAASVSSRRKEWSAGWPAGTDLNTLLTANGMSDQAMDGWCRDDVKIAMYLDQRFGAGGDPQRAGRVSSWIKDLRQRANLPAR